MKVSESCTDKKKKKHFSHATLSMNRKGKTMELDLIKMHHRYNINDAKEHQRLFRGPLINDVDKSSVGVGQVTTAILRKAALAPWGSNLFKRRISLRLNPPQFLPRRAFPTAPRSGFMLQPL